MKRLKYFTLLTILVVALVFPTFAFAQDEEPPVQEPVVTEPVVEPGAEDPVSETVELLTPADLKRIGIVLFLIFANFIAAVLVAIAHNTFDAQKLPEFFWRTLIPFVGGFLIFQAALHVLAPSELIAAFGLDPSTQFSSGFDASFLWLTFGAILVSVGRAFAGNLLALFKVGGNIAQGLAKKATPKPSE